MKNALTGVAWVALYVLLALMPLAIVGLGHPPKGRPFLVEFSVALGFVGLAMMGLQFALIARFKAVAAPFGIDALTRFHREVSYVALAFILAHPILLFIQNASKYVPLLNVFTAPWRARFAVSSVVLLLVLVGASLLRKRLRLSYEVWQVSHGVLAVAVVVLALAHIHGVGYYVSGDVKRVLFWFFAGGLVALLAWIRILEPLIRLRHPWRITAVKPERGGATTVMVEPVHHEGLEFEPGQFGWIVVGRSAFARVHHPFSFSSRAEGIENGRVAMTIKASGDFTNRIASFPVGTRVYLDGPHGVFSIDRQQAQGYVFIGGGVGITPLYSMLLTMREREDVRPVTLLCASNRWEDVIFREELEELEKTMPNVRWCISSPSRPRTGPVKPAESMPASSPGTLPSATTAGTSSSSAAPLRCWTRWRLSCCRSACRLVVSTPSASTSYKDRRCCDRLGSRGWCFSSRRCSSRSV